MAIDLQKSLDNVRKQMGTYKPTAADVGKIDLNKSLQNVKALQKRQQEMLERRREEQETIRNKNLMEATQKMSEYRQVLNPTPLQSEEEVSTQRAATASYPRLSIGERVGQTLAGLQEGSKTPTLLDSSSFGGVAAANSPKQILQNRIDELKQRGQRTDENGVKFYQTEQGEKELRAAQDELAQVFYQLTGQYVKINSADDAEKLLNRLPEVPWGRWAQVDANAGQAMQAIADRQDAEQRGAADEYYQKYGSLMEREDFSDKSRYQSTATGEEYNPAMAMFRGSGFGDLMYDYINKNQTAVERQQLLDTSSGLSALGLDQSFLQTMTGDEVKIYNYLYATEGRDSANEYLQYIQNALTARQRQETQEWFSQYAQENPVKASAFSTLLAPARGLAYLGQTLDLLQDGTINQNAAYNKFADVPNAIRETVAENWGPTGSFLYQTGMSMADFLMTLGISGGNSTLSMAIMGSGAAADTVIDAKDRGLTDLQAFTLGTIAGAAEALTEKVSIESLLDMTSLGKNAVGYIIKNALAEAGEEAASGIINTLTDIIISKDKSRWQQEVDRYFAQGMTKSQAVNLALMNQAKSIGLDALGGALSGGVLGGTVAGTDAFAARVGEVNWQNRYLRENFQKNFAELPRVQREVQMETLLEPLRKEQEEAAKQWERQRQMERLLQSLRDGSVFEQGENRAVQNNAQAVDVIQGENQQANQGFAQETQRTQQTPVQSNAQAQTENVDIMETPVETQEPEEIQKARALIAQYEANGGTLNGQQERSLPAADGQGWQPDQSAGEQAGGMEGGTIELESYANQGAVARSRQNRLRNIEAGRTNPEWLNLDKSRYDIRRIQTFPEEAWDGQMQRAAQRAFEKGVDVQYFAGTLRVGGTRVDGVNLGDGRILIQADSQQWSVDQLTDHELMHTYLAEEYGMRDEMIKKLETQDLEGLNQMVLNYVRQYEGVIDLRSAETDEEAMQRAFAYVIDEIICDAYAGMNRRGWGTTKFSETVRATYENRLNGRDAAMSQDVRGPPMETRYSLGNAEVPQTYEELIAKPDVNIVDIRTNATGTVSERRNAFINSAAAEEMYKTPATNKDTGEPIFITKKTLKHAMWNYGMEQVEAARSLREVIEEAVLTSRDDSYRETDNTTGVYHFFAAVRTDTEVAPAKLTVKEFRLDGRSIPAAVEEYIRENPGVREYAQAYDNKVLIAENEEADGIILTGNRETRMQGKYPSTSTISVDDLMQLVKGDARKYIPKPIDNRNPTSDVDIRYSVSDETDDDVQVLETAEESAQPEPERKRKRDAHTARKELRADLMNLFSVPVGLRGEAGRAIDNYAQQIIERGSLNNYDRDALFDILHNYGEMTVPAGEYEQTLRGAVKGAKVYVPDGVKAEFGEAEDWNEFKREAFAAGVYFTSNQQDPTADVWNQELSEMFPGAFDPNETDASWILRQIVNVAEQGKSEKMTLAEYAASLAEQYGPEVIEDYYANMERQMDQLLNSFADKARFENNLRERTENQLRRDADYRREQRERQRQTRHLRELQQKTLKQLQWLSKNRNKAPADLKKQFEEVLSDIDVFAVSAANEMNYSNKYGATWRDLKEMYLEAQKNDPNWLPSKDLDRIVSRLTDPKLEDFNYNELNDLYRAALGLRQELYNRRNLLNDNRMFEEVYDSSVKEISEAAAGYEGTKRDRLMNLQQLTPMNVIERMADWNPNSAWLSMGKQLEQGERDTKKFAIQSNKLLQRFIENNKDWIETADGQGKDAIWYEYELPELTGFRRGDAPIFSDKRIKVYMTPAMKIQLFLESKSYDNLNHMLGGRRFADKDMYTAAKGDAQKRREAMAQGQIVRLTPEMVRDMVKDLTPQELELANILGNGYYNGFAKQEINRVSNILYGYDKAMSSWYTPIFTDQSFNKTEPGIYDATAEGAGNLKERVRMSTNPSLNLSAFDAFERSVSQTSKFVGMAIPVRNWNTLMNWRSKDDSMKNAIATKWGAEMQNYLDDVVVRLQNPNVEEKTVLDEAISGALSNYISAVFGLNPSVVAKQFGSFYMAIPYLGVKNMPNPKQIHNVDPEIIAKYSPELDDRLMGYAIPEVSQLKEKPNWSQRNKAVEFVAGGGAITAMDGWTAKTLWPWAENKVAKETGLQRGTDEFYRRVAVEFDNAIVRSQSINDVMHRSKLMNSKNAFTRAFTMFKTDSAQSYNILREAFGEMQYAKKHGDEAQKKAANKKAAYAVLGIAANNLWAAAITALINLWKAKGKNYRDEEGNLTLLSVAAQYTEDVLTSMAGIVIGGEEIADVIASLLGGDKFYGIDIAGGEQLSEIVDEIVAAGTGAKEILTDGYYILNNGGDLGEYLEDRGADLIGAAKEMAQKLAKYLVGLPVDNLEAYLVGTLRWAAPQAVAAYEDALKTPDKAGLKGLEGKALNVRMGNVLNDRMGGASDATVEELARLYAADLTDVVPPAEAEKIGEETLTADEQQAYRISLHNTLGMHLDEFVASERYQGMDDEAREQSLKWLYSYAKEIAKSGITGEDPETNVQRINELLDNGMAISEALAAYDEFTRANKLLEAGLEPELSADVAQAIHDKEDENGPDVDLDNLERYEIMLDAIGNEITRYAAMAGLMPEKERARFQAGHDWVDSETYVKFLREWKTQYPEDDKSQEKVKKLLKGMELDNDERAALWQMCNKSWKWEKNPFDRSIGKEIAAQIEASYAEIDGE